MRILLDCRFQKGAGPNVTMRYMIDNLVKLNKEHELVIIQHKGQPLPDYPGIKKILVPLKNPFFEFFWVQLIVPGLLKRNEVDVCHSLKHVGPLFTSVPTILHLRETMHFLPEGRAAVRTDLPNKIYWNYILVLGLKRATHIVGVSDECRKVITKKLGIPESKVSTVYQGLNSDFNVNINYEGINECRKRYNLPERYILCVGNFYHHKNYNTVIKMFRKLRDYKKDNTKLVMVGDTSYASSSFFNLIKSFGLKSDITFTDFVKHNDLVNIYQGASLFLFPPRVASFPNPCLEAMACGIPVVASNLGSISEVTGGAALLFNNLRDENEMLEAVWSALYDRKLREELRKKGLQRVKEFSWSASASKLLQLYETVAKSQNP